MFMLDLMIILFHLKLDKFYCIGAMNYDYSISPKIRQILLHWGYELVESVFFVHIKMSYYCFNRQKLL